MISAKKLLSKILPEESGRLSDSLKKVTITAPSELRVLAQQVREKRKQ